MTFPRPDWAHLSPYRSGRVPTQLDLSDNTNLWGPHPAANRALRDVVETGLTRYPHTYADRVKEAVSERFGVPADCVTTGCGSDDVLDSAFRAAAGPDARMTYLTPTFSMAPTLAAINGLEAQPVVWDPWASAPPSVDEVLGRLTDLIYLCRPNNPTGVSLSRAWVTDLLERVGADGPLVLLDEAYADFAPDAMLAGAPDHPRLLVLRTMSKAYGLAGLRVGFAVGAPDTIMEIEKSRGPYKVSAPAEAAAAAALADTSGWTENVIQESHAMREALTRSLRDRGFDVLDSDANFVLLRVEPRTGRSVVHALRDMGVSARPFDVPDLFHAVRVTVAPWELLERFLMAFDQVCTSLDIPAGGRPDGRTGP